METLKQWTKRYPGRVFWTGVAIIYAILFLVERILFVQGVVSHISIPAIDFEHDLRWGLFLFWVHVVYTLVSFRIVREDEWGAKIFFGWPYQGLDSGLAFVPLFIFRLRKETKLVVQEEYPDEPERIWKGDQTQIPEGMIPPLRIVTGVPNPEEQGFDEENPLETQMTLEPRFYVRFHIVDFLRFITVIGSLKEAVKQTEDTATAILQREFAKRTPASIIRDLEAINQVLTQEVNEVVGRWGLKIDEIKLESTDLGLTVNTALRNVPTSKLEKQVTIIQAEAEKQGIILKGEGIAQARKTFLGAEAVGYMDIALALGLPAGDLIKILQNEAARAALEKAVEVKIFGFGTVEKLVGLIPS